MDKRGDVILKTALAMMLSIVSLFILIYGLNQFAEFIFPPAQKEQAKGEIDKFSSFLNSLSLGEMNEFILLSPKDWWLSSFTVKDMAKPTEFFTVPNVICICNKEDCGDSYYCSAISKPIYENGRNLNIKIGLKDLTIINQKDFYDLASKQYTSYKPSNIELDAFLSKNYPALAGLGECIVNSSDRTGVPASVILGVAIHESASGTSGLAKESCSDGPSKYANNLFGVKGTGSAGSCNKLTHECLSSAPKNAIEDTSCTYGCAAGTKCYALTDSFRAYYDKCQSVSDFADIISTKDRYKSCLRFGNESSKMTFCILAGGYSTDANWAKGVNDVIVKIEPGLESSGFA